MEGGGFTVLLYVRFVWDGVVVEMEYAGGWWPGIMIYDRLQRKKVGVGGWFGVLCLYDALLGCVG